MGPGAAAVMTAVTCMMTRRPRHEVETTFSKRPDREETGKVEVGDTEDEVSFSDERVVLVG